MILGMKHLIKDGFVVKCYFKTHPQQWGTEIAISGNEETCAVIGPGRFREMPIDEAIDFFLTFSYNIDNHCLLFEVAEKRNLVADVESIEYFDKEEIAALVAAYEKVFEEDYPLSKHFRNKEALETIAILKKENQELMDEDE